MLPDNRASTVPVKGKIMAPDSFSPALTEDYELGGVALNDVSQGLMVKTWHLFLSPENSGMFVEAPGVPATLLFYAPGATEVALAFDQAMRYSVAYMQAGVLKLNWFDTQLQQRVTTEFGQARSPRMTLDDKRNGRVNTSDIILAYIRGDGLYYRQQRDRFTVERLLRDGITERTLLTRVGMNNKLRLQFDLGTV